MTESRTETDTGFEAPNAFDLAREPLTRLPEPATERWRPLRAGLQNLWQFDHTTRFVFHRGRLLLRGRNGAGKTKVVELLLPFLLEGRLDPRRLDPFGNRSRKMHYNLLHEGNRDQQTSSGYAWIEFGRQGDQGPSYMTIGAGLKARRSTDKVTSWFFVVRDRRIDVDLDLLEPDRRPKSAAGLTEALGDAGEVFPSAHEYRAAVNRALFGLDTQQYESLVDALLRLRQPHLSERLDPAQVGAVLSDSLPPLDTERVREVAEGFERIETHRRELAERRTTLAAVGGFLDEYRTYVGTVAAVRAATVLRSDRDVRETERAGRGAEKAHAEAVALQAAHAEQGESVERERAALSTRIRTIQTSDEYRAVQQLQETQEHAEAARDRAERRGELHSSTTERVVAAEARQARLASRRDAHAETVDQDARQARRAAATADLGDTHAVLATQLVSQDGTSGGESARGTVTATAAVRATSIRRVQVEAEKLERALRTEEREAERLADAEEAGRDARSGAEGAEGDHAAACATHREGCERWLEELEVLVLDGAARAELLDAAAEDAGPLVRGCAAPTRLRLDAGTAEAELALAHLDERRIEVRSARDTLASATHEPPGTAPWRTADRAGRAGAPLYMLIEFNDVLSDARQARVEAALEAAGLLDAWVTPAGDILDGTSHDAFALSSAPGRGRTLADVTNTTPSGGVPAAVIGQIAAGIAVLTDGACAEADLPFAWIAPDGRFGLGPLRGRSDREQVAYVGEVARAAERARRLATLERQLAALDGEHEAAYADLEHRRERRRTLEDELDRLPAPDGVLQARVVLDAAVARLADADRTCVERGEVHAKAVDLVQQARAGRESVAREVGLSAHLDALEDLAAATTAWQMACGAWIGAVEVLSERADAERVAEQDLGQARAQAEDAARERTSADRESAALDERVRTLKDVVGATGEALQADLARALGSERELRGEGERLSQCLLDDAHAVGVRQQALEDGHAALARARDVRVRAVAGLAELDRLGVLRVLSGDAPRGEAPTGGEAPAAKAWERDDAVKRAREVADAGPDVPRDPDAVQKLLESAMNTVARRQQELRRALVAGVRLTGRMAHGVLMHDAQYMGKTYSLPGLVGELQEDVAEREQRLAYDEQDLLEEFLRGELHEHVRSRIREAEALVEHMNTLLADCPTATGQRLRLAWRVGEDAPPGTKQAVGLLLRGAGLLTDAHREHLRSWLHERLRAAREGDGAASLRERIARALDYRGWHRFFMEFSRGPASGWRRLTRKTHGTGSGGEKAVMLHLPLFAAMAAHYQGRPTAPRLIVLDEVFAGIDRGTRGQLMHLLVKLDLDAVLTSHEEWGFYAELDGISTYHLVRDPEMPGVLPEWFVWDGRTRFRMTDEMPEEVVVR